MPPAVAPPVPATTTRAPARPRHASQRPRRASPATLRGPMRPHPSPGAHHGAIAQLGERLDRTQEVAGSSPASSTPKDPANRGVLCVLAPARSARRAAGQLLVNLARVGVASSVPAHEDRCAMACTNDSQRPRRRRVERGIYQPVDRVEALGCQVWPAGPQPATGDRRLDRAARRTPAARRAAARGRARRARSTASSCARWTSTTTPTRREGASRSPASAASCSPRSRSPPLARSPSPRRWRHDLGPPPPTRRPRRAPRRASQRPRSSRRRCPRARERLLRPDDDRPHASGGRRGRWP